MLPVTEAELDALASLGNSINLTFLGISLGAVISFSIALWTDGTDARTHSEFMALAWLSGVLTLYFAIRSAVDHRSIKARLRALKK